MRVAVIAGARPNFVKIAPLLVSLAECGIDAKLVHTGQHYDWAMSEALFRDLGIPEPDANLEVGSETHAVQTAKVMISFAEWLDENPVDQIVTVGDVNSTLACALVGAKLGLPVAHVEAGLRSFDHAMPEEINRLAVDAISTWLFTPSADADENLIAEGVHPSRIHRVGNIMVDSLLANLDVAMKCPIRADLELQPPFGLVTLHRPALVDDPARFAGVLHALDDIAAEVPLLFPVHPRTRATIETSGLGDATGWIRFLEPLGYLEFLCLEAGAAIVLTDSGGIQEETTVLGVPCLTLRDNTERPITVTEGTNHLVGTDPDTIRSVAARVITEPVAPRRPELWDGHTASRIAAVLAKGTPEVIWTHAGATEHHRIG
ncbi:MAG TPA: UDP-N-acetylglucosamine 2-epimerase (non-hydrolyzing) [Acidimicrobiia bacterium]|nr:UDP-N-acetylglucosamine 2-epimerase (non-hydrolyzing) [Acidimicrobiia bacterium]